MHPTMQRQPSTHILIYFRHLLFYILKYLYVYIHIHKYPCVFPSKLKPHCIQSFLILFSIKDLKSIFLCALNCLSCDHIVIYLIHDSRYVVCLEFYTSLNKVWMNIIINQSLSIPVIISLEQGSVLRIIASNGIISFRTWINFKTLLSRQRYTSLRCDSYVFIELIPAGIEQKEKSKKRKEHFQIFIVLIASKSKHFFSVQQVDR